MPAEDVLDLQDRSPDGEHAALKVAVPKWPRLSNFDDLDPLAAEPDVSPWSSSEPRRAACRVMPTSLILPGSKATLADLAAFRDKRLGC